MKKQSWFFAVASKTVPGIQISASNSKIYISAFCTLFRELLTDTRTGFAATNAMRFCVSCQIWQARCYDNILTSIHVLYFSWFFCIVKKIQKKHFAKYLRCNAVFLQKPKLPCRMLSKIVVTACNLSNYFPILGPQGSFSDHICVISNQTLRIRRRFCLMTYQIVAFLTGHLSSRLTAAKNDMLTYVTWHLQCEHRFDSFKLLVKSKILRWVRIQKISQKYAELAIFKRFCQSEPWRTTTTPFFSGIKVYFDCGHQYR